jgi:transposase InsO family protein
LIAAHLSLAGFRIAEKTVRNIKRERIIAPAEVASAGPPAPTKPVAARFVHHVWMMDVTEVKTLFGAQTLYFAAVFDAFSRMPLAGMTFAVKPGGAAMTRLFKHAVKAFGRPKYLITDRGGEFIARVFKRTVARLGVKQRFATADDIRATARLERFWKSLKQVARIRLVPPLDLPDLEHRLSHALAYYAFHRPHSGLENRTPIQAFMGIGPRPLLGLPRGRKREPSLPLALRIGMLQSSCGDLGILIPAAA